VILDSGSIRWTAIVEEERTSLAHAAPLLDYARRFASGWWMPISW